MCLYFSLILWEIICTYLFCLCKWENYYGCVVEFMISSLLEVSLGRKINMIITWCSSISVPILWCQKIWIPWLRAGPIPTLDHLDSCGTLSCRFITSRSGFSDSVDLFGYMKKNKLLGESNPYNIKLLEYKSLTTTELISNVQLKTESIVV